MKSKTRNLIVFAMVCLQTIILPTSMQASSYRFPEDADIDFYATANPAATQCTVTKTADSGSGTLRQCLLNAVAGVVIDFDPNKFQPTKPISITVASPLPAITVNDVTIDGSNAGVILDGSSLQRGDGLVIQGAQGVTIRGLAIRRFPQAGFVIMGGAKNNVIGGSRSIGAAPLGQGNLISNNGEGGMIVQDSGTTGNIVLGNDILRNIGAGVRIRRLASQNTIGTDNVISGNGGPGVWISDANPTDPSQSTSENQVAGNYIGVDATGAISVTFGNSGAGVYISDGARKNIVGGQLSTDRNVISNNGSAGIAISDANSDQNRVLGNLIGTDVTGAKALRNDVGIGIWNGAKQNIIGGVTNGERNLISGNARGITIWDPGTTQNKIIGNLIGTDVTGTQALPNGADGINIGNGAQNNVIGGATLGERNIISGNGDDGFTIQDEGTDGNRIIGNFIGTDITGKIALGNTTNGVLIIGGPDKTEVGGQVQGEGNVISGNLWHGILIRDPESAENVVQGNLIGTDVSGNHPLGNGTNGISILQSGNNLIGGAIAAARNVISANGTPENDFYNAGIWLDGVETTNNKILGNFIGTDSIGKNALGNIEDGILIGFSATNNFIGGATTTTRNLISGNGDNGIIIQNSETIRNQIIGNYIGTDITGEKALGNANVGILLVDSPKETEIKGNLISGNHSEGIIFRDAGTSNNRILGNFIGTDASGKKSLGNAWSGIALTLSTNNNTIGGVGVGERNIISGNGDPTTDSTGAGILLIGANANKILGNYIGTDSDGLNELGNKHDGITIVNQASDNIIGDVNAGNVIGSNGDSGVWLEDAGTRGNSVSGNQIGTDINGTGQLPNKNYGVYLGNGAISNTIGVSNTIVYNLVAGVAISGTTTTGNKITRNSIHNNRDGQIVWLTPNGVNQSLQLIDYSFTNLLSGQACPHCTVEVYANPENTPAGALYVHTTGVDESGAFTLEVKPPPAFAYWSALQIMPDGTTSQFANGLKIMTGFNLYLPVVTNSIGRGESLQAGADATNIAQPSALYQSKAQVATKSGKQDLLSGGEKQDAHASRP